MTASLLDDLRGVGPARKRALLEHFGSPERIVAASREEIEAVPGLPGKARPRHPPPAQQGRMSAAGDRGDGRLFDRAGRALRDHRLLGRREVGGDRRVRGLRVLLRRQPAAADDRRARRALSPRRLERPPRRRRHRRPRRRVLRRPARRPRRARRRRARPAGALPRGLRGGARRPLQGDAPPASAGARRAGCSTASAPSARCSSRCASGRTSSSTRPGSPARSCGARSRPTCSARARARSWR